MRRLDAFAKTRPDLQQQSVTGGVITLCASIVTVILFVSQVAVYIVGETTNSLALSESSPLPMIPLNTNHPILQHVGRLPIRAHVTFPHVSCDHLDMTNDGASYRMGEFDKFHGGHAITMRKPTYGELSKILGKGNPGSTESGCTVQARLRPQMVAGTFSIGLSHRAWAKATTALSMGLGFGMAEEQVKKSLVQYNVSHYIHAIEFGTSFPYQDHNPLQKVSHVIDNEFYGIAVSNTQVQLIPTSQAGFFSRSTSYQTSVVDITVQPSTLAGRSATQFPGLVVTYDFAPLTVLHSKGRDNIFVFLSSLISIVAGAFVTVQMLTGCLVHSAKAVAKKID